MPDIVVIGDVGGCAAQLTRAVAPLVDDPDTVIIQVGDLVDRGPDSRGVLDLVRARQEIAPERWIQLVGNHEAQYLGGEPFWPTRLDEDAATLLRTWWLKEWLRVAAAVRTREGEELLICHAGMTVATWRALGEPVTAATAADLLNTRPEELLWDSRGGPLWAEAASDLYGSWLDAPVVVPFGQVHGHSTVVSFARRAWLCPGRIRQRTTVDWAARHTFTRIRTARFIGVDPKHGRFGTDHWAPLTLPDATLLA
ncbi:hypothetical protein Val02_23050 [Virgisporangium aliadipatigenens]|uniref:Calcineurin-like phosphoesterase domain-containing protein n=1 Tax=Virgisporangium aliadipatigenens TaxID=741659 RepID=A0A8J3YHK6_9ACTN|nr:metallophosphoesterase [Virgisporangium aliadipatigenens]GIJ45419.1 hypothetical protein Val02_23050 [Virgisporangium aliadipatigenens]